MDKVCRVQLKECLTIFPSLNQTRHKGQNGKIGIIGGSIEYTGAPYYAAISSLKTGSDLAFIFCHHQAAIPIKCYSPEPIVYPIDYQSTIQPAILERLGILDCLVIGPGLGREPATLEKASQMLAFKIEQQKGTVIMDADYLWYLAQPGSNSQSITSVLQQNQQTQIIITPNRIELNRLLAKYDLEIDLNSIYDSICQQIQTYDEPLFLIFPKDNQFDNLIRLCNNLNINAVYIKGPIDIVVSNDWVLIGNQQGGRKRTGGLGDQLVGALSTAVSLAQQTNQPLWKAMGLAHIVSRKAQNQAWSQKGMGMTAIDCIKQIQMKF